MRVRKHLYIKHSSSSRKDSIYNFTLYRYKKKESKTIRSSFSLRNGRIWATGSLVPAIGYSFTTLVEGWNGSLQADVFWMLEVHVWSPLQFGLVPAARTTMLSVSCIALFLEHYLFLFHLFFFAPFFFLLFCFPACSWMIWFNCQINVKINPVQCALTGMHIQINWVLYPADHLILYSE